jgi:hypothetical protein
VDLIHPYETEFFGFYYWINKIGKVVQNFSGKSEKTRRTNNTFQLLLAKQYRQPL